MKKKYGTVGGKPSVWWNPENVLIWKEKSKEKKEEKGQQAGVIAASLKKGVKHVDPETGTIFIA